MADTRFTPDTDDAPSLDVLTEVARCAAHWAPRARLVGNVRAGDIVRAVTEVKSRLQAEAQAPTVTREQIAKVVDPQAFAVVDRADDYPAWKDRRQASRFVALTIADSILALLPAQAPTTAALTEDTTIFAIRTRSSVEGGGFHSLQRVFLTLEDAEAHIAAQGSEPGYWEVCRFYYDGPASIDRLTGAPAPVTPEICNSQDCGSTGKMDDCPWAKPSVGQFCDHYASYYKKLVGAPAPAPTTWRPKISELRHVIDDATERFNRDVDQLSDRTGYIASALLGFIETSLRPSSAPTGETTDGKPRLHSEYMSEYKNGTEGDTP